MKRRFSSSLCSSFKTTLWSSLLVVNAIGTESLLAIMMMLMVANLRNLDVPLAFSSFPSILAAATSMTFVISLGFISEKFAKSKRGKSLVLALANLIQFAGAILVIWGNLIKLLYFDHASATPCGNSTEMARLNNSTSKANHSTIIFPCDLDNNGNIYNISPFSAGEPSFLGVESLERTSEVADSESTFYFHTLLVLVGFALLDAGYDPTNCFMKIYIMANTPPEMHTDVMVKSTFMSACGGVLITLLGSFNVDQWLTADTSHNVNIIRTIFITGIALIVGILSSITSLLVGWFYGSFHSDTSPEVDIAEEYRNKEDAGNERERLLPGKDDHDDDLSWSASVKLAHSALHEPRTFTGRLSASPKCLAEDAHSTVPSDSNIMSTGKQFVEFFRKNNFRLFLCLGTLFAICTIFAFDVFAVNFVGVAIYKGDPTAEVHSQMYSNFLQGEKTGSTGLLLFYVSSFAFGSVLNFVLQRFGWWRALSRGSLVYILVNFCCAYFLRIWLFYLASCLTGCYRMMIFTFPYVLIAKRAQEKQSAGSGGARDLDMVLTTAMSPAGFLMASSITGPLVSWTENSATSVYLTVATTTMTVIFYWFIRRR